MSASQALETGSIPVTRSNADVAQLVEQCFRKAKVAGSNPAIGSILKTALNGRFLIIRTTFFQLLGLQVLGV